jgi:hypothetical protein
VEKWRSGKVEEVSFEVVGVEVLSLEVLPVDLELTFSTFPLFNFSTST